MISALATCAFASLSFSAISAPPVEVSARLIQTSAASTVLNVTLKHRAGVHTWPNQPVVPSEFGSLKPIATTLQILELNGASAGQAQWPAAEIVTVMYTDAPVKLGAYQGLVQASVHLKPATGARSISGRIAVRYQPCDERICYPPRTDTLSFKTALPTAEPH